MAKCAKSLPASVFLKYRPVTALLGILGLDWNQHGLEELGLWVTRRERTGGGWWMCGPACYFALDINQMGSSREIIRQQHLSRGSEGKRKSQWKLETAVVLLSLSAESKKINKSLVNSMQECKIRLDVTALPGGLCGAMEKVEAEKHILVSLHFSYRHNLGKVCVLETSPWILFSLSSRQFTNHCFSFSYNEYFIWKYPQF